jgi:hypothetical protein
MVDTTTELMVVTVRFGPGHPSMPNRRNSPISVQISRSARSFVGEMPAITILSASPLTLVAISCATFGLWRVGTDLEVVHDFVFQNGFLSHWQVWSGFAVGVQYASW